MNTKPVITSLQLLLIAVGSALVFPYTFMPILNSPPANQDVWIALIMAFVYILLLNTPVLILMNKFRGVSINQTCEIITGKIMGKIILIPFIIFTFICFTACMLITTVFLEMYVFDDAPSWALMLFMVVPAAYAAYKGAGTIARIANFIVPVVLFSIVLFFLFGLQYFDTQYLKPVLTDSIFLELNLGAFFTAARYSEILIFWVFSYYLVKKASINKTYAKALTTFGVAFMLILIPTVITLGMDYAKLVWNPYYAFTRQLEAFGFIERMQALNILSWFPMALLKLTIYIYMGSEVISGILKTKSHRPIVFPIVIAGYIMALMPFMNKTSTVDMLRSDEVFPFIIIPVVFIVPVIILAVYIIRKKKADAALKEALAAQPDENEQ
ncbi:MAG: endospore germination permease [Christensenellales bacterium]